MSEFQAIHDAIKEQYGFNDWGKTTAGQVVGGALALGPLPVRRSTMISSSKGE